jgi:hypothetical protein
MPARHKQAYKLMIEYVGLQVKEMWEQTLVCGSVETPAREGLGGRNLRSWRSSSQLRWRALVSADVVVLISARRFALLLSRRRYTRWARKLALPGGDDVQSSDPIVALAIFVHLLTTTSVGCLGPSVLLGEFRAGPHRSRPAGGAGLGCLLAPASDGDRSGDQPCSLTMVHVPSARCRPARAWFAL